jgi:hypothetical protein
MLKRAVSGFRGWKKSTNTDSEVFVDAKNPWQGSLQRLAEEHKFTFEHIEQSEELATVVNDIAESQAKPQPIPEVRMAHTAKARAGDKTIQDMKSWWKSSLTPEESSTALAEVPGRKQMLKRWFE